jgi:hypothetical protein
MGVTDTLNSLESAPDASEFRIWLDLPDSYLPLPLRDIDNVLAEAETTLRELCPPDKQDLLYATLGTFSTLLDELAARNAVYCGLGWHQSPTDGEIVSSTLIVSIQHMGEERNPRLVLGDLVTAAANAGDQAQADLVDLANGPALFVESVRSLPRPTLPGQTGEPGVADVYQLQATVPSPRGEWIVVLEFSTPQVEYGVLYREMMILLANSVSVAPPPGAGQGGTMAGHIHDLLGGGTT